MYYNGNRLWSIYIILKYKVQIIVVLNTKGEKGLRWTI